MEIMAQKSVFATRLRSLREREEMSQEEFATRLGLSQQQITRWETGKWTPQADALVTIARGLGITVDYLLGMTDNPSRPVDTLTDEEREIINLLRRQREQQSGTKAPRNN